jgi:exopolysaccharide production protein ExoY
LNQVREGLPLSNQPTATNGLVRGHRGEAGPLLAFGGLAWGAKRMTDIALALLLLTLTAPALLGAIALIIVVDRQRPFYIDERVGRNGRLFKCLKLRTLRADAALLRLYLAEHPLEAERYRRVRKLESDPRKSRLGAVLRRHSIDELPQLLNVLVGQMSIVGPRPLAPHEWQARGPAARDLLLVKPGLTGPWQVSGRSDLGLDQRVIFDSAYARSWSLLLDLKILAKTPLAIIAGIGAK